MTIRRRSFVAGILCATAWILGPAKTSRAGEDGRYDLRIAGGKVQNVGRSLRVKQGEAVTLAWSSDEPVTLHLHGYDIEVAVAPDAPGEMAFEARAPGRFAITTHGHAHGDERTVLYLEVHPD